MFFKNSLFVFHKKKKKETERSSEQYEGEWQNDDT